MQVIGLCRFSYPAIGGFQVEHASIEERIAYLYNDERLEERFRLFETVTLPAFKAQTDPDFELIIVIGDQLPLVHETRLRQLIRDLPQARIRKEPPRRQREVMKELLNDARQTHSEPCLQFRHDDDDAVAVDFVEKLRAAAETSAPLFKKHKSVAFDWNTGYTASFGANGISAAETFRQFGGFAIGMYVQGNCPLTIMNFAHEKLPRFMPAISMPDPAMWVRSHNGYNDSRQKVVRGVKMEELTTDERDLFQTRFAIDAQRVAQVFSMS